MFIVNIVTLLLRLVRLELACSPALTSPLHNGQLILRMTDTFCDPTSTSCQKVSAPARHCVSRKHLALGRTAQLELLGFKTCRRESFQIIIMSWNLQKRQDPKEHPSPSRNPRRQQSQRSATNVRVGQVICNLVLVKGGLRECLKLTSRNQEIALCRGFRPPPPPPDTRGSWQ